MSRRVAVCLLAATSSAYAQLTLNGVRCGQLSCALDEYCSPETDRCAPCSYVCNKTHHNYDAGLCVKECQDYIHDLRYGGHADKSAQQQARAALIISSVALAVLLIIMVLKCVSMFRNNKGKFTLKYIREKLQPNKNRVRQYPADLTHHNPHAELPKAPKNELKLEIRSTHPDPPPRRADRDAQPLNVRDLDKRTSHTDKSQGATTPKTVSTCLTNRHPAEDTTLDNPYSYDNMGMNVTPPPAQAATHNF